VLAVLSLVPWLGTSLVVLVAAIAAGATLISRFGRTVAVTV
jgi:hypothetical protein